MVFAGGSLEITLTLFFSSIEPAWSRSMTRLCRSLVVDTSISSMISGSVCALTPPRAPVSGQQPEYGNAPSVF